ncbi:twin-arginine translocation signal domain-containing protein [Candidatus Hydrogenedentota bacterium]
MKRNISRRDFLRATSTAVLGMTSLAIVSREGPPDRTAEFDPETRTWFVLYTREPNRWLGDHFSIHVNDTTGELKYFGGR